MTKLQKQKQFVKDYLSKTLTSDSWGNFKLNGYRIKLKKNLLRFEKKYQSRWSRIRSIYYKDITKNNLDSILNHMKIHIKPKTSFLK